MANNKLIHNPEADKLYKKLAKDIGRGDCFLLVPSCYKTLSEQQVDSLYRMMEKNIKQR